MRRDLHKQGICRARVVLFTMSGPAVSYGPGTEGDTVKGDRVEIVIDAGGDIRTYEIAATRAGRRVEVSHGRGLVEVTESTRGGTKVRTARFMANRVLALVEHPASQDPLPDDAAVTQLRQPA
jgi:hypothetical protein